MLKQGFDGYKTFSIIFWTAFIYAVLFNFSALEADRKCKERGWDDSVITVVLKPYCLREGKRGIEKASLSNIRGNNGR